LAKAYDNVNQFENYEDTCNVIISKFPNNIVGYLEIVKYYEKDKRHDKIIKVYSTLPKSLKSNEEFNDIYKKSEFQFTYLSSSYQNIGRFINNFATVKEKDLYGFVDKSTSLAIPVKFNNARNFIEDNPAVLNEDKWFFIDKDGEKTLLEILLQ